MGWERTREKETLLGRIVVGFESWVRAPVVLRCVSTNDRTNERQGFNICAYRVPKIEASVVAKMDVNSQTD